MLKKTFIILGVLILALYIFLETYTPPLSEQYGNVQSRLYIGDGSNQPLIVGFGGAEGGNAWDSDYWKPTRDSFLIKGYAFLAMGYFGTKETPNVLDRISLDAIHQTMVEIAQNPQIDQDRIAIIGGSKGGELVLNLASYFDDIDAVVAMAPSHISFAGLTTMSNTSSWMLHDEEVPFALTPYAAVPAMISGDHLKAYQIILTDKEAVEGALIPVQNINGPILLLSGSHDEAWPSTPMCKKIVAQLEDKGFPHSFEHVIIEGGHTAPLERFDLVFDFFEKHFPL